MQDLDLWRAWVDGDEAAGNALVRRHFLSVHRFFSAKVGEHADDLTQRTFLAMTERAAAFRQQGSVRGYLFGIARKQLLRHFEGRGRLRADQVADSAIVDLDPSPSRLLAEHERGTQLIDAMRHIPLDHQIIVELFYWEELSVEEVAEALSIPKGTVKSRLSRARDNLRKALAQRRPGEQEDAIDVEAEARATRDSLVVEPG